MKFKKGDRVEYIGNDPVDPISYGDKGNVIGYDGIANIYDVEWDKGNPRMHDNFCRGRRFHCWSVREKEIRKVKEENKMEDLKSMLKTGMIVVLRNGDEYIVLKDFYDLDDVIACKNGWSFMSDYDNDICMKNKLSHLDIVEIKKPISGGASIRFWLANGDDSLFKTIWKREEPKEMTVSEIEKELGYKIKVVADKEEKK